jgi:hypothetical protein
MIFYSKSMNDLIRTKTNGYYHVRIGCNQTSRFLSSNNERAFVTLQIQQLLAARSVLEDPLYAKSLAHHIDLLAYSISEDGIQLLAYCIDVDSIQQLVHIVIARLDQFRSDFWLQYHTLHPTATTTITKLAGEHESLKVSADIHLHHKDWEYDRYSSIGFYLHDRRGDWMRLWRLTRLYDNDPTTYRQFILQSKQVLQPTALPS